jgi:hypothetical protein
MDVSNANSRAAINSRLLEKPFRGFLMNDDTISTQLPLFDIEEWRPVVGYEQLYEISNKGRVRKYTRIIASHERGGGYTTVSLYKQGGKTQKSVHRLVALAFLGQPIHPNDVINHKDGNPRNNHVENLEWCTQKYNVYHAYGILNRTRTKGEQMHRKLTEVKVREIRTKYQSGGYTIQKLADIYGVNYKTAWEIINYRIWKHIE